ncbi:MAG: MarR family transcriptional regulator [Clostridia bacterium]|nr:MarR family transcriptional regulator [Clostridia bacterium]
MGRENYFEKAAQELFDLTACAHNRPLQKRMAGLSRGEMGMLRFLVERGRDASPGEIARAMDIGSGGVANLLNSLEKKGCLSRSARSGDRRGVAVTISEAGRDLVDRKEREGLELTARLLSALGEEDTGHLLRICRRIADLSGNWLGAHSERKGSETEQ